MNLDGYAERRAAQDDLDAQRWDSLQLEEQMGQEQGERDAFAPCNEQQEVQAARAAFRSMRLELKHAYAQAIDPTVEANSAVVALRSAHVDLLLAKADLLRAMLRATRALGGAR